LSFEEAARTTERLSSATTVAGGFGSDLAEELVVGM
jgi:hypothetical protein